MNTPEINDPHLAARQHKAVSDAKDHAKHQHATQHGTVLVHLECLPHFYDVGVPVSAVQSFVDDERTFPERQALDVIKAQMQAGIYNEGLGILAVGIAVSQGYAPALTDRARLNVGIEDKVFRAACSVTELASAA